jgi:hypothetical protein
VAQGTLVSLRLKDCVINRPLAILHRKGFVLTPAMRLFIKLMKAQGGGMEALSADIPPPLRPPPPPVPLKRP